MDNWVIIEALAQWVDSDRTETFGTDGRFELLRYGILRL